MVTQQKTRAVRNGAVYRLHEQYVPYSIKSGALAGFFILYSDITERADLAGQDSATGPAPEAADAKGAEQDLYVDAYSEEVAGSRQAAEQMVAAIERNDFKLLCQRIQPLAADRPGPSHYEVLIRLLDEDQNTSSPGAFFPLVEKYGLMPKLDRWVVEQVAKWASFRTQGATPSDQVILFINLAGATIDDPDFPVFVGQLLQENKLDPGGMLRSLRVGRLVPP